MPAKITDHTPVILLGDDDEPVRTTFGAFIADNEFGPEWVGEIRADLIARGEHHGGGGATPDWSLSVVANEIAPASARKVGATFSANPSGEAWAVYRNTTWKDRDGWDGDCTRLAHGLTEAEARARAAQLTAEAEAAVAPLARSSVEAGWRAVRAVA